jgi:hypothetical protein
MKIGRNDPCPCGSGKKYKRCCLSPRSLPADAPADPTWRRLRGLLENHSNEMLRFIGKAYGPSAGFEAWDAFGSCEDLDPDSPFMQLFLPWFFHRWAPDPRDTEVVDKSLHDVSPTRAYLAAKEGRLDPLVRSYLESALIAPFSFFEVLACDPGTGLTLRDVMTKEEHPVTERGASRGMERGDLLFGQLVSVDRLTMLEAFNGFCIPPMEKAQIIALRARIASVHQEITHEILRDRDFELLDLVHEIADRVFNPPLPILQNTDGDPISPHKLTFDLKASPQAAFDALRHLAVGDLDEDLLADATRDSAGELRGVRFNWKKLGNKIHTEWDNTVLGWIEIDGASLVAEVNSQARAEAARRNIETALDGDVHYLTSEIESPEQMLADLRRAGGRRGGPASEKSERLAQLPEVREKISQMMAGHWERWVNQPLPVLGNRTPMDAVKDPDGREIVESIVIQGERAARRPDMPTDEAVFQRLRARLGLAESGVQSTRGAAASGRGSPSMVTSP